MVLTRFFFVSFSLLACWTFPTLTSGQALNAISDSSNLPIEILSARSLRQITFSDTLSFQTLAGNARVRQGNTFLSGDSISINRNSGIVEVFGQVHINDADTVHVYAQYLRYLGNEQTAYLKKQVKLTDGNSTLTTEDLVYNIPTGIASYETGGKVINGGTILTSKKATYYSDTRDVLFSDRVKLKDPQYDMFADSLRYNTVFKTAYFISETNIKTPEGKIKTKSGRYNLQTGEALFDQDTKYQDSSISIRGERIALDKKNDIIQIEEHGILIDSANQVMVLANQILINRKEKTFLATRKPVMVFYRDKDSTFITADTLFSGKRKADSTELFNSPRWTRWENGTDSIKPVLPDSISFFTGYHHVRIYSDSIQAVSDSMYFSGVDSVFKLMKSPICWNENNQLSGDTMWLFTKNSKPERLQIFNQAMLIQKTNAGVFNQVSGKTLNAEFQDSNIEFARIKGQPAESIYYPEDENQRLIGMNYCEGEALDVFFNKNQIQKIKYIQDVKGTLYPMNMIPPGKNKLNNATWTDENRPKSKWEIFE
jgi:lipopolysaccharide export system protein LptA